MKFASFYENYNIFVPSTNIFVWVKDLPLYFKQLDKFIPNFTWKPRIKLLDEQSSVIDRLKGVVCFQIPTEWSLIVD